MTNVDRGERFLWLAGIALLVQVILGAALRGVMAGVELPVGHFPHTRHAHSHLGYYGLLFPLLWWAWARAGLRVPGPVGTAVYGVATLAATIGFAQAGYGLLAIAASTVVLGFWLHSAWSARSHLLQRQGWWGPAGPSILLSSLAIPGVAVTLSRDPALARELVQGFLTLLLFGAVVPAALASVRVPPPLAPLWTLGALGTALVLGPWPALPSRLAALLLVGLLLQAAWRAPLSLDRRLLWAGVALALAAIVVGLLPESHPVAIGGLHFAILGPVLLDLASGSLARPLVARTAPRLAYLAALGVLTVATMWPWRIPGGLGMQAAALAGATVAVAWLASGVAALSQPPPAPAALDAEG